MKFDYLKFDEISEALQDEFKLHYDAILILSEKIADKRCRNYLISKLEESYMWTGKGIRQDQINRTSESIL